MALPPSFLEELRARTPLPALIGRRVKLARSGRQWKGCCPFHGEKTPSFYVYEDHYHCFGCGVHGDAISFVMQAQGASFIEAVEQLASEAGLEVPKEQNPQAIEAEKRRHDVISVLDLAQRLFQRRLFAREGAAALDYLRGRGLSDETIRRFGLGWSGEGRGALAAEMKGEGIEMPLLLETGLMQNPEDGRPPRELFFNRVMFPIRDRRGRVISFGGRTLGNNQPKYVNGPETAVFAKRRTLYGLDLAREGARKGAVVVAVEGYMDVIALHQAGFPAAVAPLGTALTADQLEALWQISPEPVLCFDGDAAGARAAARAAEAALPLLEPKRSIRIATLPNGEDPDTLVAVKGEPGFQAVLDAASPLSIALFDIMREGTAIGTSKETPEIRAAFRQRIEAAAALIPDKTLGREYRSALLERMFSTRRQGRQSGRQFGNRPAPPRITRLRPEPAASEAERMRCLTAILLRHPTLLHDVEEAFFQLDLPGGLARIRSGLHNYSDHAELLDSAEVIAHLTETGLAADVAQALAATPMPLPACAGPDAMPAEAEAGWWQLYGLTHRDRLEAEVAAARRAFAERADAASERRLTALATARDRLARGEQMGEQDAEADA
jgi:DNA primase